MTDVTVSGTSITVSMSATASAGTALWNAKELQGFTISTTSPTDGQALVWDAGNSWWEPATSFVPLSGATMTGPLQFSGTDHVGIVPINLTSDERTAVAAPTNGAIIWNTTRHEFEQYNGSGWEGLHSAALIIRIRNESGGALAIGQPVYITGYSVGQELVTVDKADATSLATMPCIAVVHDASIANNASGLATIRGRLKSVDTSAFTIGDKLYVSSTAGEWTATQPTGTEAAQAVATVLRVSATEGVIEVWGTGDAGEHVLVTGDTMAGALDMDSNNITNVDLLSLDATPDNTPSAEGQMGWSATDHTLNIVPDDTNVTLQVGRELHVRAYNNTGAQIDNGDVVYSSGTEATEDRLTIALAQGDAVATARVLGVATANIAISSYGYVTQFGDVNGIDLSAFSNGDLVWLSTTVAGGLQNTEPESPDVSVFVGTVIDNGVSGRLFVTAIGNTGGAEAGDATQVVVPARKGSVGTITKGQAVYVSGYNLGQGVVEVELADADNASAMPALGIANVSITNAATGDVVVSGRVANIDTSLYSVNDALYVSTTAGALTGTRPAGISEQVQKVANVLRSNASNGVIQVVGAGRTNDIPNLIEAATFKNYGETVNALGDLGGGTDDIDLTAGNVVSATVSTATQTFTFSNPPASGTAGSFTLFLTNGGSQTVNWPASVDWAGGTAPTLTAAGVDILTFTTIDAGTTWFGFAAGLAMA